MLMFTFIQIFIFKFYFKTKIILRDKMQDRIPFEPHTNYYMIISPFLILLLDLLLIVLKKGPIYINVEDAN